MKANGARMRRVKVLATRCVRTVSKFGRFSRWAMVKALAVTMVLNGCVSVESVRRQVNSADKNEVAAGEKKIMAIVKNHTNFTSYEEIQQYISLLKNNDLRVQLIVDRCYPDVAIASASFENGSDAMSFIERNLSVECKGYSMDCIEKDMLKIYLKALARVSSDRCLKKLYYLSAIKESEYGRVADKPWRYSYYFRQDFHREVGKKLARVAEEVNVLQDIIADRECTYDDQCVALSRISDEKVLGKYRKELVRAYGSLEDNAVKLAILSRIKESEDIQEILEMRDEGISPTERTKMLSRMSENVAVNYVTRALKYGSWGDGRSMYPYYDAVAVASMSKDSKSKARVISALIRKIESDRRSIWTWDRHDDDKVKKILSQLPLLGEEAIEELICADSVSWKYYAQRISSGVAYNVLAGGKAGSCELELGLVKRLPKDKIDMKVYNGVRFAETKKAVNDAMSPEMKRMAEASSESVFKAICEKAKAASKETFELDGFYLGMSFDDMKIVFAHHFPRITVKESFDGDRGDSDYVIYVDGQSSPFCYATRKDKKIYQFNFGKKLLKKWYQFDVQTPMEWANAFAQALKIDMKFKLIEKEATVYEPMDMSRYYTVWFHQESYQYKHNMKEYRLIYFGEEKDFTFEGGIGGSVIKGLAAPRFRYVRGDQGSLRVTVERD